MNLYKCIKNYKDTETYHLFIQLESPCLLTGDIYIAAMTVFHVLEKADEIKNI